MQPLVSNSKTLAQTAEVEERNDRTAERARAGSAVRCVVIVDGLRVNIRPLLVRALAVRSLIT
jgi:hypothetical protein